MNKVLTIAGMHRSGTSLIASVLGDCGMDLGERLVSPNERNPRGFYEDSDFLEFHQKLMDARKLPVLVERDFEFTPSPGESEAARGLVSRRQGLAFWGWKEPRTTLFLDFWDGLIAGLRVLVLYRHPIDVWLSLLRAGDAGRISIASAFASWAIYNRRALDFVAAHPDRSLVVHIDAALADISSFAGAVARFAGLGADDVGTALAQRYVSRDFRAFESSRKLETLLRSRFPDAFAVLDNLDAAAAVPPLRREGGSALPIEAMISHLLESEQEMRNLAGTAGDHLRWASRNESLLAEARQRAADWESHYRRVEADLQRARALATENEAWARRTEDELGRARALAAENERWARETESRLQAARDLAAKNEKWARQAESNLESARAIAAANERWARNTEELLAQSRALSEERLAWAKQTELLLAEARASLRK